MHRYGKDIYIDRRASKMCTLRSDELAYLAILKPKKVSIFHPIMVGKNNGKACF